MTEAEWFTTAGPDAMQQHMLRSHVPIRRFQLFVVACGDTIWDQMDFETRTVYEALRHTAEGTDNRKHKKRLRECLPLEDWLALIIRASGHARVVHDAMTARARDVFGNPFRPVAFSPSWRTDTAVSLARAMYDAREFSAMPILADALQDAGCDSDAILNHCRDATQVHVRGCRVVDLVLGKA